MSSYYPTYVKTILKTGAILHLLTLALGTCIALARFNHIKKDGRPRRRFYKAGKFDSLLQVRDERHREIVRPFLNVQPGDLSDHLFEPLVAKKVD